MDENVAFARKHGYVTTLLGRKRMIPEIRSSNYNVRSFGERAAMNMPLQGSSADIIKLAMLRIASDWRKGFACPGSSCRCTTTGHRRPTEEREEVAHILQTEMENAVQLSVPLVAEVALREKLV